MSIALHLLVGLFVIAIIFSLAVCVKRLFQYDRLVETIGDDLDQLVVAIEKVVKRELLTNAPEAIAFHRAMLTVRARFAEHILVVHAGKDKKRAAPGRPPVVA